MPFNRHIIAVIVAAGPALVAAQSGQPPQPPPTDTVTPAIAGVCAAGTKVTVIKSGFQGTEGPIGLPDGSLFFTETQANRITRIAADGTTSTFLENTNGANGLAWDAKGRLISVQTTPGQTKIGALYPKGSPNKDELDQIIRQLIDDGTLTKLSAVYLGAAFGQDPAKIPYFTVEGGS